MKINAVSLHHHTTLSFLDGAGTPLDHATRAAELGYGAMAVTEHGNVSSHFPFEQAANAVGIKPLFGIEAYTASSFNAKQQTKWHLTILAKDEVGYRNLNRAVTESWQQFYYHPTLIGSAMARYRKGLFVLSGCTGSYLNCMLLGGKGIAEPERPDKEAAEEVIYNFAKVLPDSYYLEVQAFPELERTCITNKIYAELSRLTGVPLVATMDVHYPRPADSDLQVILHACGPQGRGNASADEMLRRWNYDVKLTLPESDRSWTDKLMATGLTRNQAHEAVSNTARIAAGCNVTLPKAARLRYPCPDGMTAKETIWQWLRDGWRYRGIGRRDRAVQDWYLDRLTTEMKVIEDKDFIDFFLATADVVKWAKDDGNGKPIPVGPGRGSAAASLVCWLLRITEIDPHRYPMMMFERFIDVNRNDAPDIDIDFADDRRAEIRAYLEDKYGADCVGSVANFVHYRAKNAIADVARVYQIPKAAKEAFSGMMVESLDRDSEGSTIETTVNSFETAKSIAEAFPDLMKAARLERGNIRGMSVHAAGIVIANSPLTEICAVYEREGRQVLSIDKRDAEYAGMLKLDALGLTTIGMMAMCLDSTGMTLADLYAIPDDDPATLAIFQNNDVTGVFQFDGRIQKVINRNVRPRNFLEIADVNALSRPGPLVSGTADDYCEVKHGRKKPVHYHPVMDYITKDTYFQIVYQEQILQLIREIGDFAWADVNEIRRIIAKSYGKAALDASREHFLEGAERKHGIGNETAAEIWRHIVTAGSYAFNIAHAISYSMLGYWCAYFKAHYPPQFYAASLSKCDTSTKAGKATQFKLMQDAMAHGINIKPPRLDVSRANWIMNFNMHDVPDMRSVDLIAGWNQVTGIGDKMADAIESNKGDGYKGWQDMTRVPGVGKKKADAIQLFSEEVDPFGLTFAITRIASVKRAIDKLQIDAPMPDDDGNDIAAERAMPWGANRNQYRPLVYAGIVKDLFVIDTVENIHSRTGKPHDEILEELTEPELRKYGILKCFDHTQETVTARISRFAFPRFSGRLNRITQGHDVVIIVGYKTPGFGNNISVDKMYVIDPD